MQLCLKKFQLKFKQHREYSEAGEYTNTGTNVAVKMQISAGASQKKN